MSPLTDVFMRLQVIELQQTIGSLVIALIEENGPGASQVAKVRLKVIKNHNMSDRKI